MSVKIRLAKTGKKHRISYRIVAQDTKSKRDSNFLQILGHFLPYEKKVKNIKINEDKINIWIKKGAKPTLAVSRLLKDSKHQGVEASK